MKLSAFSACVICALTLIASAQLPSFESDESIDAWVRDNSPFYRSITADIDKRGGYRFRRAENLSGGAAIYEEGRRWIALSETLSGGRRISTIIFEVINFHQEAKHGEIDSDVRQGVITDATEYAIMCELVEFDGYRFLYQVLAELDKALKGAPRELLQWIHPGANTFAEVRLPLAYDTIKAQRKPGAHHDRYRKVFAELKAHINAAKNK